MHRNVASFPMRMSRSLDRIAEAVHSHRVPAVIEANHLTGEPVGFDEAIAGTFEPFEAGTPWGRGWSTSWFRITATIPDHAGQRLELDIDLGFTEAGPGFQAEGLAYLADGTPLKGVQPRSHYVAIPADLSPGDTWTIYVEAASNARVHRSADTRYSDLDTTPDTPIYTFAHADVAVFEAEVWHLWLDLKALTELAAELPENSSRRTQIEVAAERALDLLDLRDIAATAARARDVLAPELARPARDTDHRISAIGHAHIDSAWLWPIRETVRKCSRTFSNAVTLAEQYPDYVFGCSQAVQYAWMRDQHPRVWERLRKAVAGGQFVPIGGMWVECDSNLPGGEAMVRQFTYGKQLFESELGAHCEEVWLPDTFGYSGALPQICRLAEGRWFLSQKMSWNTTDVFPHHTFWWEGIDGTRVFTHFPPSDTYNAEVSGAELARSASNFKDAGKANSSLLAYGYGDGGGGPTREMVELIHRTASLEGSPRVVMETPRQFFTRAQAEYVDAPVWVGEMYLEFHRGTYTTQVEVKQSNRRAEHLLFEAELWWATAAVLKGGEYPYKELDALWRDALLMQFHDILPGSSIGWVYRDAAATYAHVLGRLEELVSEALDVLAGTGTDELVVNAAPHARGGVAALASGGRGASAPEVTVTNDGEDIVLENVDLTVRVGADGTITSIVDRAAAREIVPAGQAAGVLQLHPDHPNQYEAWDIEGFYRNVQTDLTQVSSREVQDGVVVVTRGFDASTVEQRITLDGRRIRFTTIVDWHEQERLLKLSFPLALHTDHATSEIQFGHVSRPIHENTSWDAARFETAAQRWVHVGEPDYGVALVNSGTYGHDVSRPRAGDSRGALPTTIRASLVRGPIYPDPRADLGTHTFQHTLLVGTDIEGAVREGYAVALPGRRVDGTAWHAIVTSSNPDVVVSAVKLADDRSGDVIVRVYESSGARAAVDLSFGFEAGAVRVVNLLERTDGESEHLTALDWDGNRAAFGLGPFQIVTLRVSRSHAAD